MELNWGNYLQFSSENEYYETLGFLCKEVEVIKVYIEDNRKAGARGIQGRLRVVEGDYETFPRPLVYLFENNNDKRPSLTEYVRNLRDNHCFTKQIDPTGNNYTTWLYKSSLEDVKKTVPQIYHKDFMRGYLWEYKTSVKMLNREFLYENANKKKISKKNESKNKIVERNAVMESHPKIDKKTVKYDLFLSHSSLDRTLILSLVDLFIDAGYRVYVDWIEDEKLDRAHVTPKTAQTLRRRMNSSRGLAYIATSNIGASKWCPWELGYFDGKKGKKCCILPIMAAGEYAGQEYLGLYPYLKHGQSKNGENYDFWVYDQESDKHISLRSWLDGNKL